MSCLRLCMCLYQVTMDWVLNDRQLISMRSHGLCNRPSLSLPNIILFEFFLLTSLKVFKTRLLRRSFHTRIKNVSLTSPSDVGFHNRPPVRGPLFSLISFSNQRRTPNPMWDLTIHPFETRRSHCHSFPSPINVGSHNPPPSVEHNYV